MNADEDGGDARNNFESPDNVDSAGDKEMHAGYEHHSAKQNQKVFNFQNIPDLMDVQSSSFASNSVSNVTNPPTPNLSIFSKQVSPNKKRPYLRIISADNPNM